MNKYYEKKIAVIRKILAKVGGCTIKKAIKLLYICDKVHLLNHGRTITYDSFYAMKNGPVPSCSYDIIKHLYQTPVDKTYNTVPDNVVAIAKQYLTIMEENNGDKLLSLKKDDNMLDSFLSQTDKKIIDHVCNTFGSEKEQKLIDISHTFEEWKNCEKALSGENGQKSVNFTVLEMLNLPIVLEDLVDKNNFEFVKEDLTDDGL